MKNRKFRAELICIIHEAGLEGGCDKARGALLYTSASKVGICAGRNVAVPDGICHQRRC